MFPTVLLKVDCFQFHDAIQMQKRKATGESRSYCKGLDGMNCREV
jgi:hypothetical protein